MSGPISLFRQFFFGKFYFWRKRAKQQTIRVIESNDHRLLRAAEPSLIHVRSIQLWSGRSTQSLKHSHGLSPINIVSLSLLSPFDGRRNVPFACANNGAMFFSHIILSKFQMVSRCNPTHKIFILCQSNHDNQTIERQLWCTSQCCRIVFGLIIIYQIKTVSMAKLIEQFWWEVVHTKSAALHGRRSMGQKSKSKFNAFFCRKGNNYWDRLAAQRTSDTHIKKKSIPRLK